ncbi:hypothetical protein V6767_20425 [Martelella sp. FLE1502]
MSILEDVIYRHVNDRLTGVIEDALDKAIEERLLIVAPKVFARTPDRELTRGGWNLALMCAMREHWPDYQPHKAVADLSSYLDAKFGDPAYTWTYNAARNLAREYVADFGEPA